MPQFLKDLYEKNKVLAWIVGIVIVPVIILFFFKDIAMSFLASGAQKDVNNAKKKSDELQKEINTLKTDSAKHEAKAELLDQQAEKVKTEDDEDWHKKRGFSTVGMTMLIALMIASCFMIYSTYRRHMPIASVGDCVITNSVKLHVMENHISEGAMDVEAEINMYPFYNVRLQGTLKFVEMRDEGYTVLKGCQDAN